MGCHDRDSHLCGLLLRLGGLGRTIAAHSWTVVLGVALPVFIINVTLVKSAIDLLLNVLRKLLVAIDVVHVHVALSLHVLELLGGDTTPEKG